MAQVDVIGIGTISPAHRKTIQILRPKLLAVSRQFAGIREKLSELAPKVLKLFTTLQAEHDGLSFVDFCRMFDHTIPTHAANRDGAVGYRNHPTYNALAYMRRLVQTTARAGNRGQGAGQGVRDSATDGMARLTATLLQVVDNPGAVWMAIQKEFGFTERLMTRLRKRVEQAQPIVEVTVSKPAKVGEVIHVERKSDATPDAAAQPGQRVSVDTATGRARKRAA